MNKELKKADILTIPNLLSFFRLLLIPCIIWSYITLKSHYLAVALVALSALTDVLDGFIARKFHMISDFGKILDPFADKLTQATMIICLLSRYQWMWALITLFVIKELISAALAYLSLKASGAVNGAQWYGKINTLLLYAVMLVLFLFPQLPLWSANLLIGVCGASLLLAFLLYIHFFWELVKEGFERLRKTLTWQSVAKIIFLCLWIVLILFCLVYRDRITTETILGAIPKDSWIAAIAMLALFSIKSMAVFIYAGILYAANGLLFSLPIALLISFLGSWIMFTIPYVVGRVGGSNDMEHLSNRYPNIKFLQGFPSENKFFLNFITRIIGILPADVVSLYMGTVRVNYAHYILGSLVGMSVSMTTFTVMGMSVNDISSPTFRISLIIELASNTLSLLAFYLYKRHQKKKAAQTKNTVE